MVGAPRIAVAAGRLEPGRRFRRIPLDAAAGHVGEPDRVLRVRMAGLGRLHEQLEGALAVLRHALAALRSEEHTSELQSLMRISYAVFCLKKKKRTNQQ